MSLHSDWRVTALLRYQGCIKMNSFWTCLPLVVRVWCCAFLFRHYLPGLQFSLIDRRPPLWKTGRASPPRDARLVAEAVPQHLTATRKWRWSSDLTIAVLLQPPPHLHLLFWFYLKSLGGNLLLKLPIHEEINLHCVRRTSVETALWTAALDQTLWLQHWCSARRAGVESNAFSFFLFWH